VWFGKSLVSAGFRDVATVLTVRTPQGGRGEGTRGRTTFGKANPGEYRGGLDMGETLGF